jgi:hypothetical protein
MAKWQLALSASIVTFALSNIPALGQSASPGIGAGFSVTLPLGGNDGSAAAIRPWVSGGSPGDAAISNPGFLGSGSAGVGANSAGGLGLGAVPSGTIGNGVGATVSGGRKQ